MNSQAGSNKKMWIWILSITGFLIFCVLCAFLYFFIFQPIVSHHFVPAKAIHKGVEFWDNNTYTDFESGDEFYNFVLSTEHADIGEIVDFYHIDNHRRDNPIYGKMCDIFAIEIQSDASQCNKLINDSKLVSCGPIGDYTLFLWPKYEPENELYHGFIAINDATDTVRFLLLTDTESEMFTSDYSRIILRQSSMSWNTGNEG